ncbi:scavenger receptor cysteine-rich domain-containing group B protein [Strongylocentrotus purpuratus]|uniref:SRCR domain-containing protein n=1 Tax=Strongylocentrotus purpuratus TaxID=7668 RepID=A0A7M7LLM0_STRPU|nr:scavenger receptor cysteine-rich domain-containing group B protein [Strongylocentrotus purpuratus]|eukprot:XP_003729613.1 PREDICTED: scavenger receptor cysteine-rich domain-containing group B protein [Strongylocentrotus purpuratus]
MASNTDGKLARGMRLWIIFSAFFVFWPNYVRCQFEGDVRLVDGAQNGRGRVEIYHDNQWGTICDDTWDTSDAQVVCRQLGFGTTNARGYTATSPGSGPIHLDGTHCFGTEYRLDYCSHSSWGLNDCVHSEDAAVSCDINEGDVRLVGGFTPNQGRVEIYHNYQWGTVCDDRWGDSDARVVCRQLGYSGDVGEARSGGTYGRGSDPTYLDEVGCLGYESRLADCSHDGWGIEDCTHSEDAGVYCNENVPATSSPATSSPATSSLVVGIMSFVGVSLFLLTMSALIAVYYTCSQRKPAIIPTQSNQIPLSTITSHPVAYHTAAAATSNSMTTGPTQPSLPQQPPATETDSLPSPPSYNALQGGQSDSMPQPN